MKIIACNCRARYDYVELSDHAKRCLSGNSPESAYSFWESLRGAASQVLYIRDEQQASIIGSAALVDIVSNRSGWLPDRPASIIYGYYGHMLSITKYSVLKFVPAVAQRKSRSHFDANFEIEIDAISTVQSNGSVKKFTIVVTKHSIPRIT